MANESLLDQFTKSFGNAVADIREKVVEEPFFGRAAAPDKGDAAPAWPEAEQKPGFGSKTTTKDVFHEEEPGERHTSRLDQMQKEIDKGFDR